MQIIVLHYTPNEYFYSGSSISKLNMNIAQAFILVTLNSYCEYF